jgi:hypothetical protein
MITSYFKLIQLPQEVKDANGIKSKTRLDCIKTSDVIPGGYQGLTYFVNKKSQLYFYLSPAREFVSASSRRRAEWSINGQSVNLTSIYFEDVEFPHFGYGYTNANKLLKNGELNPLHPFRNDGFLFVMKPDKSELELFVIPEGKSLISCYYQQMIDGGLDEQMQGLRLRAKTFQQYEGLSHSNLFSMTESVK